MARNEPFDLVLSITEGKKIKVGCTYAFPIGGGGMKDGYYNCEVLDKKDFEICVVVLVRLAKDKLYEPFDKK